MRILSIIALSLALTGTAWANTIWLEWDPNLADDAVTEYRVYRMEVDTEKWVLLGTTAETTAGVDLDISKGPVTVSVTAFNGLESERSDSLVIRPKPGVPTNLRIRLFEPTPQVVIDAD